MNKRHALRIAIATAALGMGLAISAPFLLSAPGMLTRLGTVSWTLFAMLAGIALVSAAAKAGKLQLVQTSLGLRIRYSRTLAITLITDSAFLVSPWGAAGFGVNIGLLQRAGASWAAATTLVGADQALDLAFFAVAVPIAALFALGRLHAVLPALNAPLIGVIVIGIALCGVLVWASRGWLLTMCSRLGRRLPWVDARRARWNAFRLNIASQMRLLAGMPRARFIALFSLTSIQWLLRYGALWLVFWELGHRVPLGFVLAAQAVILHAALWTGVPAGGGASDLALAAAFSRWVPRIDMSTALVLWRFATLYCPLLLGAMALAVLTWRRKTQALLPD